MFRLLGLMGQCICCKHLHNFTLTYSKILVAVLSKDLYMQESNKKEKCRFASPSLLSHGFVYLFCFLKEENSYKVWEGK